jgi:hypothetical protein
VNEELFFSPSEEFDHIASNEIEHVNEKVPNYEDFQGTTDEGKNMMENILLNSLMITSMMWTILKIYLQVMILMSLNDWDDNFPPNDDFNGSNNGDFNGSISVEERYEDVSNDDGVNNDEYFPPSGNLKAPLMKMMNIFLQVRILKGMMMT